MKGFERGKRVKWQPDGIANRDAARLNRKVVGEEVGWRTMVALGRVRELRPPESFASTGVSCRIFLNTAVRCHVVRAGRE